MNIVRGFLAGALAGIPAGWVKLKCEDILPPRADGREAPPAVLLKNLAAQADMPVPSEATLYEGVMFIHWGFSIAFGGVYGALVEVLPIARSGGGALAGLAVWIGAHEVGLPAAGLSPMLPELPGAEQRSEAFSHLGWGLTTEFCRKVLRATIFR